MSHRWIQALLEYEPAALDSLKDYLAAREKSVSTSLMSQEGPELYRAQGAFKELQTLRAAIANACTTATHHPIPERTVN